MRNTRLTVKNPELFDCTEKLWGMEDSSLSLTKPIIVMSIPFASMQKVECM